MTPEQIDRLIRFGDIPRTVIFAMTTQVENEQLIQSIRFERRESESRKLGINQRLSKWNRTDRT